MTLKTGDPLQNGKYAVQSVLDQSDFGVTYSAKHTLLDQPVCLQTLNDVVQQRSDFAQLKQQFLAEARSLSQKSDALRILDCFEENTLPYIVLQAVSGQTPRLSDWLTLPPEPPTPKSESKSEQPEALQPEALQPETLPDAVETTVPIAPELLHEVVLPQINGASKNGTTGRSLQIVQPQVQPQRRIPIPFLVTLLIGLGLGAGAGFALRFQPTGTTRQVPRLFGKEQAFPSQGDWPITEIPSRLSVEPKIEAPLYRTNAPDYYSPTPEPIYSPKPNLNSLPIDSYPSPDARSERPLESSPSPQRADLSSPTPQRQAIDSGVIPPLTDFDSIPKTPPSVVPARPAPATLTPLVPRTAPERSPKLLKPSVISQ